jgi:hypothetical protein
MCGRAYGLPPVELFSSAHQATWPERNIGQEKMRSTVIQVTGLAITIAYAAFIIWIYATEPRTFKEVATSAEVAAGTYEINQQKFDAAYSLFLREQFRAARDEWQRADPAQGDARTQFYIAYSFYREGWGRVYNDQDLFKQGLEAANRAANLASAAPLTIDDSNLKMHTVAELKAELEVGQMANEIWGIFVIGQATALSYVSQCCRCYS